MVLVHGLWMTGLDLFFLARRLRRCGFQVHIFHYASLGGDPAGHVARLQHFVQALGVTPVHWVGHSLGGLLVRQLLHEHGAQLPPGRVVTLGTPHGGSQVASVMSARWPGRLLLGRSLPALLGRLPSWERVRPLGSIAGTLPLGIGLLVSGLPRPHDGTVAVAETELAGMDDHIALPVSHMGLVFSAVVAQQVCHFLRHGCFAPLASP